MFHTWLALDNLFSAHHFLLENCIDSFLRFHDLAFRSFWRRSTRFSKSFLNHVLNVTQFSHVGTELNNVLHAPCYCFFLGVCVLWLDCFLFLLNSLFATISICQASDDSVFITKHRHIIIFVNGIIFADQLLHSFPTKNHSCGYSAPDMPRNLAIFVVTLDDAAFPSFKTVPTSHIIPFEIQLATESIPFFVGKINFWGPIHTNYMSPNSLCRFYTFHSSFELVTEEAFGGGIWGKLFDSTSFNDYCAPLTKPSSFWNFVNVVTTLVDRHIAEFTNYNLVIILIFMLEANVALDVVINIIFVNSDLVHEVLLIFW